ncbi:MAG TPA: hypothetical protein VMX17_01570 [Candidatus Glassbacteria bacterium]|nr:hypothetical protein [Candidatus Glassbacteria bacterium]
MEQTEEDSQLYNDEEDENSDVDKTYSSYELGTRLAAIANIANRVISIYGYGVYAGDSFDVSEGKMFGRILLDDNRVFVIDKDCYVIEEEEIKTYARENSLLIIFNQKDVRRNY